MVGIKRADSLTWEENVDKILKDCKSSNNFEFKKWLKGKESLAGPFFDSYFHKRLFNIHQAVNNHDSDHFIVVAGKEGTGKSTFAIQMAAMLDPTFNINRICFKMTDYIDRLRISKPGQVFILDEGNMFLFNREAYSDDNRFMVKLFALMRQRNLITIICVPNFFTLDSYVRLHRVDTLVYIHKRGKYLGYVKQAIKTVSKEGQRTHRMAGFKLRDGTYWPGYYNKQIPVINNLNEDLYKQHKGDHFEEFLKEIQAVVRTREKDSEFLTLASAQKIIPLDRSTFIRFLKAGALKGKKIGSKWFIERVSLLEYEALEPSEGGILSSKGMGSEAQVEKGGEGGVIHNN